VRKPAGPATKVPLPVESAAPTLGAVRPSRSARLRRRVAAALVATTLGVVSAAPSSSAVEARVIRRGECSGPSVWALGIRKLDLGRLRVRFALRGGAQEQKWNVFMDHNGRGFFAGSRISGTDGLVVVVRRVRNRPGPDTIRVAAHNVRTGEVCRARATR
jgi:hypothetical protein